MGGERGHPLEPIGEPLAELGGFKAAATAMLWSPPGAGSTSSRGGAGEFVTLADGLLKRWNFGNGRCARNVVFFVGRGTQVGVFGSGRMMLTLSGLSQHEMATAVDCYVYCSRSL